MALSAWMLALVLGQGVDEVPDQGPKPIIYDVVDCVEFADAYDDRGEYFCSHTIFWKETANGWQFFAYRTSDMTTSPRAVAGGWEMEFTDHTNTCVRVVRFKAWSMTRISTSEFWGMLPAEWVPGFTQP